MGFGKEVWLYNDEINSKPPSAQNLEDLDPDFIMSKQVEQLEKEKRELQDRLKNQEKKVKTEFSAN